MHEPPRAVPVGGKFARYRQSVCDCHQRQGWDVCFYKDRHVSNFLRHEALFIETAFDVTIWNSQPSSRTEKDMVLYRFSGSILANVRRYSPFFLWLYIWTINRSKIWNIHSGTVFGWLRAEHYQLAIWYSSFREWFCFGAISRKYNEANLYIPDNIRQFALQQFLWGSK